MTVVELCEPEYSKVMSEDDPSSHVLLQVRAAFSFQNDRDKDNRARLVSSRIHKGTPLSYPQTQFSLDHISKAVEAAQVYALSLRRWRVVSTARIRGLGFRMRRKEKR